MIDDDEFEADMKKLEALKEKVAKVDLKQPQGELKYKSANIFKVPADAKSGGKKKSWHFFPVCWCDLEQDEDSVSSEDDTRNNSGPVFVEAEERDQAADAARQAAEKERKKEKRDKVEKAKEEKAKQQKSKKKEKPADADDLPGSKKITSQDTKNWLLAFGILAFFVLLTVMKYYEDTYGRYFARRVETDLKEVLLSL